MMPPPPDQEFSDLAAAVADGLPVDWAAVESRASTDDQRVLIQRLKMVADVAALHASGSVLSSQLSSFGALDKLGLAAIADPLQPGDSWGHLEIRERVGYGRYGVVYRAWDPTLERDVALKILRHREMSDGSQVVHEGRLMARVHHPNVVAVYGARSQDGQLGIWMQFIHGRTLEAELKANGPFDEAALVETGVQLCQALAAVHAVGLVHRDVKAQNVMRDAGGRVVLGDFGTGRFSADSIDGIAGTPLYLAPEVMNGAPAVERADIYSLGVLLFHLATGEYPVAGRSLRDIRDAHAVAERRLVANLRPDLPAHVAEAIDRATAPDLSGRWATAKDMHAAFESRSPESSQLISGGTPNPQSITIERWPGSVTRVAAGLVLIGVLAAGAAMVRWRGNPANGGVRLVGADDSTDLRLLGEPGAVTTRSVRALRFYSSAAELMQGAPPRAYGPAEQLLRDAITEDPTFASAHMLLAFALNAQNRPIEEILSTARRAGDLSSNAAEAERLFIESGRLLLEGPYAADDTEYRRAFEGAVERLETLLRLQPDHPWVEEHLIGAYMRLRRDSDVLAVRLKVAARRPENVIPQSWAAIEHFRNGLFDQAAPYIARATELAAAAPDVENSFHLAWLALAPAHRSWLDDHPEAALRVTEELAARFPAVPARGRLTYSRQIVAMFLTLGRLTRAEQVARMAPTQSERDDLLLAVLAHGNDVNGMRHLLARRYTTAADIQRVLWLPMPPALVYPALEQLHRNPPSALVESGDHLFVGALLALRDGRIDEAVTLLKRAQLWRVEHGIGRNLRISAVLADAWIAKGDPRRAIETLESATRPRSATSFGASTGAEWLRTRARLAEIYRTTGRTEEALTIERHLATLLVIADADHPLKKR